jgi:hypothetical protein
MTAKHDPDGYLENLEERKRAFFQTLAGDDDLAMVVRAHIHIEHELREFILAAAPRPAEVKFPDYDFASTVRLALVLGLEPTLKAGLTSLAKLRNKFAHKLDAKLTEQDAKQLYNVLSPACRADIHQAYSEMLLKHPETGRPKKLLRTAPKDLVAHCALMLWGGVVLGHVKLRRAAIWGR